MSENLFRLFVYGTLKRGYWNHERFCRSAVSIEEATVRGRLYEMPSGIPVLRVSEESMFALGTEDPLADAATQDHFDLPHDTQTLGEWLMIRGELLTLSDPSRDLPPIDRLEGYRPGRFSLYRRVLVPATTSGGIVAAWTYTNSDEVIRHCLVTDRSAWP